MKLLLLAVVVAVAQASLVGEQWETFKLEYGKRYDSFFEEMKRFTNFQNNLKEIEDHNDKFRRGEVSYSMGINQFADMTQQELEESQVFDPSLPGNIEDIQWFEDTGAEVDETINWVKLGYVTEVKQQGKCGCCWAFSAVGALEGQVKKVTDELTSFSAQNLLDCAPNNGCKRGGNMDKAFNYIKAHGVFKDKDYPAYDAIQRSCRKQGGQKISSHTRVPQSEDLLLKALTTVGPISVAIDSKKIHHYRSGIFGTDSGCTSKISHAVLLVGAGSEDGKDYWLVKNSWGPKWGENGYFRLERGKQACGITKYCLYPTI